MALTLEEATSLIVLRARQLVGRLVEKRGHDSPPFLPEEFAPFQGIRAIERVNLGTASAVLLRLHDGYVIRVNRNHHPVRQNFSCAHEIGHTLFSELQLAPYLNSIEHRTFNFNPQPTENRAKAKERLCDAAATELLMPENVFRKYLLNLGVSVTSIEPLANMFRVSIDAAAMRVGEISTEPCVVLFWHPCRRIKSEALELAWSRSPKSIGFCRPKHTKIGYPSALHTAYGHDEVIKSHRLFKIGTTEKSLDVESKGFGCGETRRVISLAFLER